MAEFDANVLESVQRRRLFTVYHFIGLPYFTNLIKRGGIWCADRLREWGDDFDDDPSKWGTWEKGEASGDYISCSVNPPMGMMKESGRPVLLELNASTAGRLGTVFIGKWPSYGDVGADAVNQTGVEWFDRMFLTEANDHAEPHPGEFLVPQHIPLDQIRRVLFYKQQDFDEVREAVRKTSWSEDVPRQRFKGEVEAWRFGRKMVEED